eukprot:6029891-Pyramimonas_sp.AAC.1
MVSAVSPLCVTSVSRMSCNPSALGPETELGGKCSTPRSTQRVCAHARLNLVGLSRCPRLPLG